MYCCPVLCKNLHSAHALRYPGGWLCQRGCLVMPRRIACSRGGKGLDNRKDDSVTEVATLDNA